MSELSDFLADKIYDTIYDIGDGFSFTNTVYKYINGDIGERLFVNNIPYRNVHLERNRDVVSQKGRYGIITDTLTSKDYDITPVGKMGWTPRIGEDTYIGFDGEYVAHYLDAVNGLTGYTRNEANADPSDRNFRDGKFYNEVIENDVFKSGASFGNPETNEGGFTELYSVDNKNTFSGYSVSSIDGVGHEVRGISYTNTLSAYTNESIISHKNYGKNEYRYYNEDSSAENWNDNDLLSKNDNYTFIDVYSDKEKNTLIDKTNKLFKEKRIGSIVARFKTNKDFGATEYSGAIAPKGEHGMSRGRNLLTKKAYEEKNDVFENGYENPYCRVWTNHYQYSKLINMIRPFSTEEGFADVAEIQKNYGDKLRPNGVENTLGRYSTLMNNGFVKIAPYSKDDITKCMFSIENLAWDSVNYKGGHKGPNGGRIMWFPPYNLSFSENVNVEWNPNDFIGRGEKIYTYKNTERSGQLDFTILVDHPIEAAIAASQNKNEESLLDNEQKLLRFFAGCEYGIIEEEPITKITITETEKKTVENDDGIINVVIPLFYPNNLSLIDAQERGKDVLRDAIKYVATTYECRSGDNCVGGVIGAWHADATNDTKRDKRPKASEIKTFLKYKSDDKETLADTKNGEPYMQDSRYTIQILKGLNNKWQSYYDNISLGLNTKAFTHFLSYHSKNSDGIKNGLEAAFSELQVTNPDYKDMVSKAFIYADSIFKPEEKKSTYYISIEEIINCKFFDKDTLFTLIASQISGDVSQLSNPKDWSVSSVKYYGGASSAGYEKLNRTLGSDRANSIAKYLKGYGIIDSDEQMRTAKKSTSINQISKTDDGDAIRIKQGDANIPSAKAGRCAYISIAFKKSEESKVSDINATAGATSSASSTKTQPTEGNVKSTTTKVEPIDISHEDEYLFFSKLEKDDKLVYTELMRKLKYFNPAFHSITPEGFNARLTFLHQCTRQGPTESLSDKALASNNKPNGIAVHNMSFGKAPYCILRIGDFYNTKILIESLSITYDNDGIKWDLNQEGIGVQPMMAKVSLGIKFLGGSDLSGPISRLQNAVSANFYANTSVYDKNSITRSKDNADKAKTNKDTGLPGAKN